MISLNPVIVKTTITVVERVRNLSANLATAVSKITEYNVTERQAWSSVLLPLTVILTFCFISRPLLAACFLIFSIFLSRNLM